MKPTNKLRFIQRETQIFLGEDTYTYRMIKILQQWWDHEDNGWAQPVGEWRDVPMEIEE